MHKITKIIFQDPFKILCWFENGEKRIVDLEEILDKNNKYGKKIFEGNTFKQVQIDPFGGLYWDGIAEMKDWDGNTIPCEYDVSPELIYMKSTPAEKIPG